VLYGAKTTTITEEELKQILQDWKKQIQDEMFQQFETVRSDVQEVKSDVQTVKSDVQEVKSNVQENVCKIDMLVSNINETIAEECDEKRQEGSSLVLIATGHDDSNIVDDSQILDIKNSKTCKTLAPYPLKLGWATGGIVSGSPIICGGENPRTDKCHIHDNNNNEWRHFTSLSGSRSSPASVPLDNYLWVTGGRAVSNILDITEKVYPNGIVSPGPKLPEARHGHCLVTQDNGQIAILGGEYPQGKTMTIYNPATDEFKPGPNLKHGFVNGACFLMTSPKHQHRNVIIAIGGGYSNKFQLLDYTKSQTWEEITDLPSQYGDSDGEFWGPRAIKSVDGQLIIQYMEHLLKLNCDSSSCSWTKLPLELKKGVRAAVVMSLPPNYVCEPDN